MRPQSPLDPLLTDNFLSWQPVHSAHLQQCPDTEIEMYGKKFSVIYDYYKLHMQMKWRKNDELRNQSSLCPSAFAKIQESDAKNEKSTLTENCFDKDEEGKEGDENNIITDKRDDEDIYLNEEETEEKKRRLRMIRQEIKEAKEFRKVFGEWVRKDWISDKDEIAMWDAAEQKIKEKEEKQMPCMENTENKGNQTILNVNGKLNESTLEELQILLKEELERGTLESDLKELMESISSKASKEEKRQRMREMSELERYFAEIDEKRGKIQKKRKEEEALKCEGIQKTEGEEQIENNKEMDNKETTSENAYLGDDKEGETGIHISSNLDERNEHLSKAIQQKGISLHSLTKSSVFFFSTKTDSSERESDLDKKEDDFPLMSQKVDLDGNNCQEIQTEGHFSDISKELSENLKNLSEHSKAQLSNNLPLILRMQPFSSSRVSPSLSTSPTFYEPFICSPNSTRTSPQISPETKKMLRNIKSSNDLCFISSKYNSSPSELLSSSPFDSKESDVPVYTMDIADSSFSTQSQHILSVQTFLNYSHASDEVYFIVPLLFLPFSKTAFNSPFDAHSFQKTANEVLLTKRKNFHEVTLSVLNQRFFLKTPPQRKFLWCFDKVEENEKKRQKVLYYKKLHSLNNGTLKDYLISRDGELEPQNPVVQTEYFPPNTATGDLVDPNFTYHNISVKETAKILHTNLETGLTDSEAEKRLKQYGPNALPAAKRLHPILMLLKQFHSVLIYLLLVVMIFCFATEQIPEGVVIAVVLIANAIIGYIQESRAEKDTEALTKMLSLSALCVRNGIKKEIESSKLVPGDIVALTGGDKIPADCRLFESKNFHAQEAALTGETTTNPKTVDILDKDTVLGERSNMVFSGTYASQGSATAIVVNTGIHTEIGKINTMVQNVDEKKTPLTTQIDAFNRVIVILCIILMVVAFGAVFGMNYGIITWQEAIMYGASIGVAVVPEGMPAIVSLTLAIGMQRMASRKALIRRLPAVETLGAVSVICSDKTGTLTTNQMTTRAILLSKAKYSVGGTGYDPCEGEVMTETGELSLKEKDGDPRNDYTLSYQPGSDGFELMQKRVMEWKERRQRHAESVLNIVGMKASDDETFIEEKQNEQSASDSSHAPLGAVDNVPSEVTPKGESPFYAYPRLVRAMVRCGVLCNDSSLVKNEEGRWTIQGDTTEGSLFPLAVKCGQSPASIIANCPRLDVIPFESDFGFMATINRCPNDVCDVKSAFEDASSSSSSSSSSSEPSPSPSPASSPMDEMIGMRRKSKKYHDILFLKGAPEKVFALCSTQSSTREVHGSLDEDVVAEPLNLEYWKEQTEKVAALGLRTLALAQRICEPGRFLTPEEEKEKKRKAQKEAMERQKTAGGADGDDAEALPVKAVSHNEPLQFEEIYKGGFTLLGVVGIFDPPRSESRRAIRRCRRAGIRVVMITGDHAKTAAAVGGLLGLNPNETKTSTELAQLSEEELRENVKHIEIYSRATPADKLRIVKALQAEGFITAMTGDGVNDAPALKQAHAGIAMGINGTEVAKEASKMILLDDNFATIVSAVEQGRIVYNSLKRSISFILPTNVAEGSVLFVSSFISPIPPINALQILWVNTITSITLSSLIPFQRGEQNVLTVPPRDTKKGFLTSTIIIRTLYVGFLIAAIVILWFYLNLPYPVNKELNGELVKHYSTMAVNIIVMCEITFLFNCVYLKDNACTPFVFRDIGWPSLVSIVILIGLQMMLTYTPGLNEVFGMKGISFIDWLIVIAFGVGVFIVVEIEKAIRRCVHAIQRKRKGISVDMDDDEEDTEENKKRRKLLRSERKKKKYEKSAKSPSDNQSSSSSSSSTSSSSSPVTTMSTMPVKSSSSQAADKQSSPSESKAVEMSTFFMSPAAAESSSSSETQKKEEEEKKKQDNEEKEEKEKEEKEKEEKEDEEKRKMEEEERTEMERKRKEEEEEERKRKEEEEKKRKEEEEAEKKRKEEEEEKRKMEEEERERKEAEEKKRKEEEEERLRKEEEERKQKEEEEKKKEEEEEKRREEEEKAAEEKETKQEEDKQESGSTAEQAAESTEEPTVETPSTETEEQSAAEQPPKQTENEAAESAAKADESSE
ncbi:putative P-type ATPase (P-ATPase) Superfamily Protein [Monocercomonoides exilis]|uniref:putative P-type ATPase (P-ATPase) Superfamily Protein n=1 Tax=Monocercomonoides exilis TaxID=2049356 RepID=UPI00355A86EA|nr:putative P-type ATPase (P-ATPase) Superfamily Protein [Monocercomonoides exilis]|eukprot:MONOS_11823.1-p1 / transcript=MONOS_11823.1 / gene=MONOS_11823 / organism=Monocercomonoides_exilis_PA203 / gene_product=P-type ATPase (P-ATPase) Superfamily Protein / transcript_product=P-type ATPase (P-ATPase) Superfamily Protein / location=Mono_scaffold00615:28575-35182(+) / protein_length=2093 / sequence_SO=supercontig / SO=protein_coding / is_pseudo=false